MNDFIRLCSLGKVNTNLGIDTGSVRGSGTSALDVSLPKSGSEISLPEIPSDLRSGFDQTVHKQLVEKYQALSGKLSDLSKRQGEIQSHLSNYQELGLSDLARGEASHFGFSVENRDTFIKSNAKSVGDLLAEQKELGDQIRGLSIKHNLVKQDLILSQFNVLQSGVSKAIEGQREKLETELGRSLTDKETLALREELKREADLFLIKTSVGMDFSASSEFGKKLEDARSRVIGDKDFFESLSGTMQNLVRDKELSAIRSAVSDVSTLSRSHDVVAQAAQSRGWFLSDIRVVDKDVVRDGSDVRADIVLPSGKVASDVGVSHFVVNHLNSELGARVFLTTDPTKVKVLSSEHIVIQGEDGKYYQPQAFEDGKLAHEGFEAKLSTAQLKYIETQQTQKRSAAASSMNLEELVREGTGEGTSNFTSVNVQGDLSSLSNLHTADGKVLSGVSLTEEAKAKLASSKEGYIAIVTGEPEVAKIDIKEVDGWFGRRHLEVHVEAPRTSIEAKDIRFVKLEGETVVDSDGGSVTSLDEFQRSNVARDELSLAVRNLEAVKRLQSNGQELLAKLSPLQEMAQAGFDGNKTEDFVNVTRKLAKDLSDTYERGEFEKHVEELEEAVTELKKLRKGVVNDDLEAQIVGLEAQLEAVSKLVENQSIKKLVEQINSDGFDADTWGKWIQGEGLIVMTTIAAGVAAAAATPFSGGTSWVAFAGYVASVSAVSAVSGYVSGEVMKGVVSTWNDSIRSDFQVMLDGSNNFGVDDWLLSAGSQIGTSFAMQAAFMGAGGAIGRVSKSVLASSTANTSSSVFSRSAARVVSRSSQVLGKVDDLLEKLPVGKHALGKFTKEYAQELIEEGGEAQLEGISKVLDSLGFKNAAYGTDILKNALITLSCSKTPGVDLSSGAGVSLDNIVPDGDGFKLALTYSGQRDTLLEELKAQGITDYTTAEDGTIRAEKVAENGQKVVSEYRPSTDSVAMNNLLSSEQGAVAKKYGLRREADGEYVFTENTLKDNISLVKYLEIQSQTTLKESKMRVEELEDGNIRLDIAGKEVLLRKRSQEEVLRTPAVRGEEETSSGRIPRDFDKSQLKDQIEEVASVEVVRDRYREGREAELIALGYSESLAKKEAIQDSLLVNAFYDPVSEKIIIAEGYNEATLRLARISGISGLVHEIAHATDENTIATQREREVKAYTEQAEYLAKNGYQLMFKENGRTWEIIEVEGAFKDGRVVPQSEEKVSKVLSEGLRYLNRFVQTNYSEVTNLNEDAGLTNQDEQKVFSLSAVKGGDVDNQGIEDQSENFSQMNKVEVRSNIIELLQQNYDTNIIEEATKQSLLAVEKLATALASANLDSPNLSCCLVGGWCRDLIMGRASSDIDIEVFGISYEALLEVLENNFDCHIIKPSKPGVAPIKLILADGNSIDILLPIDVHEVTKEIQYAPGMEIDEAASRRDFTCNAIYFDAVSKEWKDPFDGKSDISEGILRLVPGATVEDINAGIPLRACRFVAEFDLELDRQSMDLIKKAVSLGLYNQNEKRVLTSEFSKILLKTENPSKALRLADELGILSEVMPELCALKGVPQDPRHHPEGDVFEHTMLVVDVAAQQSKNLDSRERTKILWGALLHDIGKASTTRSEEGDGGTRITSYNHETEGAKIVGEILDRFSVASDIRNQVARIVQLHMRPLEIESRKLLPESIKKFNNEVRKLVRDLHPVSLETFLQVCTADRMGRGTTTNASSDKTQIVEAIRESANRNGYVENPTQRILYGKDLIDLGFQNKNDLFQEIINRLEGLRDEGKLELREDAKQYALRQFALSPEELHDKGINTPERKKEFYTQYKKAIKDKQINSVDEAHRFANNFIDSIERETQVATNNPFGLSNLEQEPLFGKEWTQFQTRYLPGILRRMNLLLDAKVDLGKVPIRIVSADDADIIQKEMYRRFLAEINENRSEETKIDRPLDVYRSAHTMEGFYSEIDGTIYLIAENLSEIMSPDIRILVTHELAHAWQAQVAINFEAQLRELASRNIIARLDNSQSIGAQFQNIEKSIDARLQWAEVHADRLAEIVECIEDLDFDPEDIRINMNGVFKVKGNFDSVSIETFNKISSAIFNCPELADVLFRNDNTALIINGGTQGREEIMKSFFAEYGIDPFSIPREIELPE